MAMQGTLLQFIIGWITIPLRIFVEIFRNIFPPKESPPSVIQKAVTVSENGKKDITVDQREMNHWTRHSQTWWDPEGEFALLRGFNSCRIPMIVKAYCKFIAKTPVPDVSPLRGAKIIDVGCGAGFVSEPLAELGADVVAVDMVPEVIEVAKNHWRELHQFEPGPDYICKPVEQISVERPEEFDMVLCMEVLDHVANWPEFVAQCCKLLRPGGCAVFSTINRTLASLLLAIIGGEHLLRIIPMDTHHLHKFIKPKELVKELTKHGLLAVKTIGNIPYNPWAKQPKWTDIPYTGVCYAVIATRCPV